MSYLLLVFRSAGPTQTYLEAALMVATAFMKSKVVANEKDRVGVTLFGTQKSSDMEASAFSLKKQW